ncbi:MAG: hypothetical protein HY791_16995 [Deltaproteobacteria bacterium]|nr:hypothetical protein [Deltaproteobacteria bacterium]
MSPKPFERRRAWISVSALSLCLSGGALFILSGPRAPSDGAGLVFGVISAGAMVCSGLLGIRKRLLRVRLGSVSAWVSAHRWLGALTLVFALFHCRLRSGGTLTTALLGSLALTSLFGLFGAFIQAIVPSVMTARLPSESPELSFEPRLDEYREQVASLIESVRGRSESSHRTLIHFWESFIVPFFDDPSSPATLASGTGATLAFDTLVGSVGPESRGTVEQMQQLCREARSRVEEARLQRMQHGWELLHIALSVFVWVLAGIHVAASLYY